MYRQDTATGQSHQSIFSGLAARRERAAASSNHQPNDPADLQTRSMRVFERVSQFIKDDHDRLRQSAIRLELARLRGRDLRQQEWEASKVFSRHSAFSVEFFLPYTIMMLVFVIHPPFDAPHPELLHQITSRLLWAIGFVLHFWFIYRSKGWLLYHVYFPLGIVAFVAATITLYSCTSLAPIMLVDALYASTGAGTAGQDLPYLKLLTLMPALVAAIILLSTGYRVIYGHPFFARISGERVFIALLPVGKRGELLSVSADDHYVRVTTSCGVSHIRLNFSNALDLLKDAPGLQVHRSHWVSLTAVSDLRTEPGGKTILQLTDDTEIPVARSRVRDLRERLAMAAV